MAQSQITEQKAKKDFYWHLSVYVVVNIGLIVINLASSPDTIWFIWPLFGWGIGVTFHALSVFIFKDWVDTKDE